MPAKLSAHDAEQPSSILDDILSSPGARIVDEH